MVCATIFEMLGALTVGARTASTIKNGIISPEAFQGNAGVQLLAFACAACGAGTWVMWCSKNNITVSSTYSLVSSLVGVGIATVGASGVTWGWSSGSGVGAIFAGLLMAPVISACFGAIIFTLIKVVVHMRKENAVYWAVWTSPFFFLIAGTICTLTIVYKGSPRLGLGEKPAWYIATVTMGVGWGLFFLSALFFLPYMHTRVIKKDYTLRLIDVLLGPFLFKRTAPTDAVNAKIPDFAVIQHSDDETQSGQATTVEAEGKGANGADNAGKVPSGSALDNEAGDKRGITHADYRLLMDEAMERHHANLRKKNNPLGWAMRVLHTNPLGAGSLHEFRNMHTVLKRFPAMVVVGALYGAHYDIHTAQLGIEGTPEGKRMARTYAHAPRYPNEVEYLYSFVQIITACTASFAHGAGDVGNAVGVWAGMYAAWTTGNPAASKEPVPLWQIAVIVVALDIGFITYGYNIMKGTSPCYTDHKHCINQSSQSWATRSRTTRPVVEPLWN